MTNSWKDLEIFYKHFTCSFQINTHCDKKNWPGAFQFWMWKFRIENTNLVILYTAVESSLSSLLCRHDIRCICSIVPMTCLLSLVRIPQTMLLLWRCKSGIIVEYQQWAMLAVKDDWFGLPSEREMPACSASGTSYLLHHMLLFSWTWIIEIVSLFPMEPFGM